mmetsp:Transcript_47411/g.152225  ORF Transcript_47411/g.152225 Transcript_47411/m.152225 type:complete len:229 (-) Transcript_47411:842-1528(-)
MILPVAVLGSSTTPSIIGGPCGSLAAAADTAAAAASACARARDTSSFTAGLRAACSAASRSIAFAISTAWSEPLISTCTGSSVWSRASTRAPLRSRISLILSPFLPMMRSMISRGSGRTSTRSGRLLKPAPAVSQPDRSWRGGGSNAAAPPRFATAAMAVCAAAEAAAMAALSAIAAIRGSTKPCRLLFFSFFSFFAGFGEDDEEDSEGDLLFSLLIEAALLPELSWD